MDLSAEQFVEQLLTKEAHATPSDSDKPEDLKLELPEWFDEKKFNQGRRFYWDFCSSFSASMLLGLIAVFAVPSILRVLIGTRRSNSVYTSYRRYISTFLHVQSWYEHELKPGSVSWRSLHTVRTRHARAGRAAKLKGDGDVSQRDVALTQFGFIGFAVLKPDVFGIRQLKPEDWEAYNHFWRTIGYMIGLEDRYNICRKNIDETREVCRLLTEKVYTPCLENVPEYFEHMAHVMLDGFWSLSPSLDEGAALYYTRYLADVPGFIYTEGERIQLQNRLKEQLKGKPLDTGVDMQSLVSPAAVEGLAPRAPRLLYLKDFECIDTSPEFKKLSFKTRYNLAQADIFLRWYTTYLGRFILNLIFYWSLITAKYVPIIAAIRFGIKKAMVDMFSEDPIDETVPKTNEYYYKKKDTPWYLCWLPAGNKQD